VYATYRNPALMLGDMPLIARRTCTMYNDSNPGRVFWLEQVTFCQRILRTHMNEKRGSNAASLLFKLSLLIRIQALCFGAMPAWLDPAVACIPPDAMPPEFAQREPRFDHMLVNIYEPGEGLNQHVDLLRFEDGIISISLSSACVMVFTHIRSRAEVPILLEPGDVLCMHGPARYEWTHGIPARLSDEWEGRTLERERRVSITLRRMRPDGWTLQD